VDLHPHLLVSQKFKEVAVPWVNAVLALLHGPEFVHV